jgi:IS30 family transposase
MKSQGILQKDIAQAIGCSESTISRELSRNKDKRSGKYDSDLAQRKCMERHKGKKKKIRFTKAIEEEIKLYLFQYLSPEQIVGLSRKEGREMVSVERIYQYIWRDKKRGGTLYKYLRTKGKKYRNRGDKKDKRGQIEGRVNIKERPLEVEKKERLGDLEIDTIIGKGHKGAIVTINDRASGVLKMAKLNGKDAEELADKVIEMLKPWKGIIHTITSDNGKEFAAHKRIANALDVKFFFADPYKSWQRGANENLNGLVRQYIPKKTNFDDIDELYIKKIETELNNRPRKRLMFQSPIQRFNQLFLYSA